MDSLFRNFAKAHRARDGYALAETLKPDSPQDNPRYLKAFAGSTNSHSAKADIKHSLTSNRGRDKFDNDEVKGWVEIYAAYWKAVEEILAKEMGESASSWTRVYEAWKDMTSQVIRGYTNYGFEAWTIPCLYMSAKYLRLFAIRSDAERASTANEITGATFQDDFDPETEKSQQLRDCEQQIKRIFMICLSDRAPLEDSRKWAIYYIINLLFKTYFKLNSAPLSRTILKSLSAYQGDMPPLSAFPKSQQVTFKYYEGVLAFLEENYPEAEKSLTEALALCHKNALKNKERILTYLIPCHLLTAHHLPSQTLLEPFPRLQELFNPISKCIRQGNLHAFDVALQSAENEFVKRRIYLTLERGRDVALRNLLRKVFLAGGFEEPKQAGDAPVRRTRIPLAKCQAAVSLASGTKQVIDRDEVECLLANMIYKGLMKGYIAREAGFLVLSKAGAFPGTGI